MAEGTRFTRMKDGREVYEVMGVYYDRKTGQQVWDNAGTADKNDTKIYRNGFSVSHDGRTATAHRRVRPPAPSTDTPEPPTAPTSGSAGPTPPTTQTNANGVTQTGRNLSGSLTFGDAVAYLQRSTGGYVQGFGKNWNTGPLPTTPQGAAQNIGPVADGKEYAQMLEESKNDGVSGVGPVADGAKYSGMLGVTGVGPVANGEAYANMVKNPQYAGKSVEEDGSLSSVLARKTDLKFDRSKYEPSEGFKPADYATSSDEVARRRAFLDAPDSLIGMKAVKAQNNFVSVGTEDFYNNNGSLVKVDGKDMRNTLAGRMTPDELKNKYVKNITESKPETPSATQNPPEAPKPQDDDDINPNSPNIPGRNYGPGGLFQ